MLLVCFSNGSALRFTVEMPLQGPQAEMVQASRLMHLLRQMCERRNGGLVGTSECPPSMARALQFSTHAPPASGAGAKEPAAVLQSQADSGWQTWMAPLLVGDLK